MLAKYMRRMCNKNLDIRIVGSFCRPQIYCNFHLASGQKKKTTADWALRKNVF